MIDIPLIDELRETRRRLADECSGNLQRYAEMLRRVSERIPGKYITSPLNHEQANNPEGDPRSIELIETPS